jgi:hypothetical protein
MADRVDDRVDKERAKAVEMAVGQIEKQFGKGSIMRLGGKDAIAPIPAISTGIDQTRLGAGVGGLPSRARDLRAESSGKTTLALQTIAGPTAWRCGGVHRCRACARRSHRKPASISTTRWSRSRTTASRRSRSPSC